MVRFPYFIRSLLAGLWVSQLLATIHVYLSNTHLYDRLTAIRESGYLTVPNSLVMDPLRNRGPDCGGGLFFTFSVGVGISMVTLAAVWSWDRLLSRKKLLLIPFCLLWVGCLVQVNLRGIVPIVSLYFLAIPLVVFVSALRWMPPRSGKRTWFSGIITITPVIFLTLLWAPHLDSQIFLKLRDHFLLSNRFGTQSTIFTTSIPYILQRPSELPSRRCSKPAVSKK